MLSGGRRVAKNEDFFETQRVASLVKTRIVLGYFKPWAKIMADRIKDQPNPRISYLDLFCGPGRYEDGKASTPIEILEHAIATPALHQVLVALFNDADKSRIEALKANIRGLPGIEKLKHQPKVRVGSASV